MAISVVVADDEPLARKKLLLFLHSEPDVRIVAECGSGEETVKVVKALHPDLLFLDVKMSNGGGFEVLQRLSTEETPLVIFTTAFDEYAVRAFDAEALDYLLKPFDRGRLREAVSRARQHLSLGSGIMFKRLTGLLSKVEEHSSLQERLIIRSAGKVVFLEVDEIDWIEAAANYVRVYAGNNFYLMRESIGRMASQLDSSRFVRVHRSVIVNVTKIRQLESCNSGEYMVVLKSGKELPCSRGYRSALEKFTTRSKVRI